MNHSHICFPGGVWPVMLTPFTPNNEVDYPALRALVEWYISQGVSGLFAVCQSSEMFFLTERERAAVARAVVEYAAGRVPVIASGHVSESLTEQAAEIRAVHETGVDAVILITNRLARPNESDEIWLDNLQKLLDMLPKEIKLGFYECPYPYKRVLSRKMAAFCAQTGRFYFLKDTSCDMNSILEKLEVLKNTPMQLYNANTATLLPSLEAGAAGYSGVMANMQCNLYVRLCTAFKTEPEDMAALSDALTLCALIERQCYPVNAKYYLSRLGLPIALRCRTKNEAELTDTFRAEMEMLRRFTERLECQYGQSGGKKA